MPSEFVGAVVEKFDHAIRDERVAHRIRRIRAATVHQDRWLERRLHQILVELPGVR